MKIFICLFLGTIIMASCKNEADNNRDREECEKLKAQAEIAAIIRVAKDCNKRKDIDCFLASIDSAFILESNESADKDRTIIKDSLKKDILRDWSITSKMYEVEQWIDSFQLRAFDTAIVYTNQFYHRTFIRPNNQPGEDDVVTTQKHQETWIRRNNGWKQAKVKELGGAIYVNGQPYNP